MRPGDWIEVDFHKECVIHRITLDSAKSKGDYPRGCTVLVSLDGSNWTRVAELSSAECEKRQKGGVLDIKFYLSKARYLKIIQNGTASGLFWSIHELYVY